MIRSKANPILTRQDIPDVDTDCADVSSVFNPGATLFDGKTLLMLRVQTRGRETVLMVAQSDDGERFNVTPRRVEISGIDRISEQIYHLYDPRITQIDGAYYVMLAADTDNGCRLATVRTADFERFELVGFDNSGDTRNGVLFPRRFDGRYLRLERPNRVSTAGGPASGSVITLSESADLQSWTDLGPVMSGRSRYWDELIGAGPPPIATPDGWLLIYHGVATHFASSNIYQAGVALLDLHDPRKVIARSRNNILEPREPYELTGQVPNVVFPSGMVVDNLDEDGVAAMDSPVSLYYGCADTCIGLAHSTVGELIEACEAV